MNSYYDGAEERKLNYRDPEYKYERTQEFIERGRAWNWLVRVAQWHVDHDEFFDLDLVVKNKIKRLKDGGEYTPREVNDDFKYWRMCSSCLIRELIMTVPGLCEYTHIKNCKVSYLYPQCVKYENTAELNLDDNDEYERN